MCLGGRGPADQERYVEALALHLFSVVDHLVKRGCYEAGEPDGVRVLLPGSLEDLRRRHHDTEVYDLEVVALQHDPDDVLPYIVHVALDGSHHHRAVGLACLAPFLLNERDEVGYGLLHHAGALHDLWQEHPARPEQIPDDVHPVHERTFDHFEQASCLKPRLLRVLLDELGYALDQRVLQPLRDRPAPPFPVLLIRYRVALVAVLLRQGKKPFGRDGAAVQDNVLDGFAQASVYLVVDSELARVHYAHRQARLYGMVEEDRVDGLPYRVVAPERERDVRDAARGPGVGEGRGDLTHSLDKVNAVVVVLLDAGGDGEDVGVEDDVLGRETDLLCEDAVGAFAYVDLPLLRVGLASFVEGHYDHRSTVALQQSRPPDELYFSLLEAYGVDYRLALHPFQASLDDRPS